MIEKQLLAQVFSGIDTQAPFPNDLLITTLADDSRDVVPGGVFFVTPGTIAHGNVYIDDAISRGAAAIVIQSPGARPAVPDGVVVLEVSDVREALAVAAGNYFASPSDDLVTIGITGTNGKTSTCWIITEILARLGVSVAQLGTLGLRVLTPSSLGQSPVFAPSSTTTPGALTLQRYLRQAINDSAQAAVLEVSSHALEQKRTFGINWDRAIFTNLSRDHLDYHHTLENYRLAKLKLFERDLLPGTKVGRGAIVNIDDPVGQDIVTLLKQSSPQLCCYRWSVEGTTRADAVVKTVEYSPGATIIRATVFGKNVKISTKLIGDYNVHNVIAAVLTLASLDYPVADVLGALSGVPTVPGRLEVVGPAAVGVYVDYAHSPDGLICAQTALRKLTTGRLITVFGCGGNRDSGKRPLMAQAVAAYADVAIVTSDNPRDEEPVAIIEEILPGFTDAGTRPGFAYHVEPNRADAIMLALKFAAPGDIVLVAGKGHEPYQEIRGVRHKFSDKTVCAQALQEAGLLR